MSEFVFGDYQRIYEEPPLRGEQSRRERGRKALPLGEPKRRPPEDFAFRGQEKQHVETAKRAERGLGILLASLGLALLLAAAFIVLPPTLRVRRLDIRGNTTMSEAEVREAALIHETEYLFSANTLSMEKALLQCPEVAGATVERVFPDTLRISIKERVPVALVLVESGGRTEPVYLDASGVAFAFALGKAPALRSDIPLITGFKFQDFRLGTALPRDFVPILASLAQLEASSPALLGAFSEIKVVKPSYGEPELLLYPLHYRVPVRTGPALNEATLRSIILVLDVLGSRGLSNTLSEIDFRTGTVVYRIKEGQSG
jgi:cell division protein FtsQ